MNKYTFSTQKRTVYYCNLFSGFINDFSNSIVVLFGINESKEAEI